MSVYSAWSGEVVAVNRGEKRVFQSLVIKLSQANWMGRLNRRHSNRIRAVRSKD